MKLCIIMPDLKSGGAERSLVHFLRAWDGQKHPVELLLFSQTGAFLPQLPAELPLRREPMLTLLFSRDRAELRETRRRHPLLALYAGAVKALGAGLGRMFSWGNPWRARQIRWDWVYRRCIPRYEGDVDITIAWLEGETSWYAIDKTAAPKKFLWFHNDFASLGYDASRYRRFFRQAEGVLTISAGCAASLKAAFPEEASHIRVLPNILPGDLIRARSLEPLPQSLGDGPILLSIGRMSPQKGFDLAIRAARILKAQGVNFRWYILGDGRLLQELRAMAERENVADRLFLPGPTENPYPWLRRADVFVQPSRYEGKSIVMDEAKLLCKPIVATSYPTVGDQLTPEEGMIVPLTAEGIAQGIRDLLADAALRQRYADRLARSPEQDWMQLYETTLGCIPERRNP